MVRATFQTGAKIDRIANNLRSPQRALKQIGIVLTAEAQENFRNQRFDEDRWPERAPVNTFGIIADFAQGKSRPPQRRFERSPVLVDTGRLRSSISFRVVGDNAVDIGTNLPYAAVHQTGGEVESETITEKVQQLLGAWLATESPERRAQLSYLLSERLTGERLTATVPERRFIGVTRQTREDVADIIGVNIFEAT